MQKFSDYTCFDSVDLYGEVTGHTAVDIYDVF